MKYCSLFIFSIIPTIVGGQQFPMIDINVNLSFSFSFIKIFFKTEVNRIASQFRSSQGSIPQQLIYPTQSVSNGFSGRNTYPQVKENIELPTQPPYNPHQEVYRPQTQRPPYVPQKEIYRPRVEQVEEPYRPPVQQIKETRRPPPKQPHVTTSPPRLDFSINYCDEKEFPDHVLETYSLKRRDYFIYNTSCSHVYFQCSIGQTFKLQCLTSALAYNDEVGTCDHKNAVKYCPEFDHILHCSIQDSCTENQFACCAHPQKCIDLSHRCDGAHDCGDGEDENNCPSCGKTEFACVKSGRCIPAEKRCDGHPDDCGDGSNSDEMNCSKNETCWGKFVCDSDISKSILGKAECIDMEKHCDGKADCPGKEDERNCRVNETKYILCENQKQSVKRNEWCDGVPHCADGSDEKYCS
uniref:Chitin-binding type-2 domain-containing protein n=1 Tax=Parastrongyloides trichosuri TaxID=131310 RepID=A0A0N4Z4S5_PARTI